MRGLEYLNVELVRRLWQELRELVAGEAKKHPQGPAGFLRAVSPLWHLLGRKSFQARVGFDPTVTAARLWADWRAQGWPTSRA